MVPNYILVYNDSRRLRETTVDIFKTKEELMAEYERIEAELRASGIDGHITLLACEVTNGIEVLGHRLISSK